MTHEHTQTHTFSPLQVSLQVFFLYKSLVKSLKRCSITIFLIKSDDFKVVPHIVSKSTCKPHSCLQ